MILWHIRYIPVPVWRRPADIIPPVLHREAKMHTSGYWLLSLMPAEDMILQKKIRYSLTNKYQKRIDSLRICVKVVL